MTPSIKNETNAAGRAIEQALRLLSRPRAVAEVGPECVRVAVLGRSGDDASLAGDVEHSIWRQLESAGWVVPHDAVDAGWRISNAGTIALRRLRSRGGAPAKSAAVQGPRCGDRVGIDRADDPTAPPRSDHRSGAAQRPGQNDAESPLDWLHRRRDRQGRRLISDVQYSAGERLRADFTLGNMMPSITMSWSPVASRGSRRQGSDQELSMQESRLLARDRFRAALAAVGPEFADVLTDVCCFLKGMEGVEKLRGWPPRSGKVILGLALNALARHYRLPVG